MSRCVANAFCLNELFRQLKQTAIDESSKCHIKRIALGNISAAFKTLSSLTNADRLLFKLFSDRVITVAIHSEYHPDSYQERPFPFRFFLPIIIRMPSTFPFTF